MRIDHIAVVLEHGTDLCRRLRFIGIAADEIAQLCSHLFRNRVLAGLLERLHKRRAALRAVPADMVDQSLEVTGDQNVHRRGAGQHKLAVSVVLAGLKEIKENLVGVGRTDQFADRKAHPLCVIGSQNVAKVAGGHHEVDRIAGSNRAVCHESCIGKYIVNNLRCQAPDIDRVGRGELHAVRRHFLDKRLIGEQVLDACLRVVEVSVDTDDSCVGPDRRHHLSLLDGGYAVLGIKDHDLGALNARKASQRRLAGVAACRRQDHNLLAGSVLGCRRRHQIGQNRERHILKRDRGSVEQLQVPGVSGFLKRYDLTCIKLAVIGAVDTSLELLLRIIRKKKAHDCVRDALVIHGRKFLQSRIQGRDSCGDIETTVFGESTQDRLGGRNGRTV